MLALAMNDPAGRDAIYLPRLDRWRGAYRGFPGARRMLSLLAYRRMWRSRDAARAAELADCAQSRTVSCSPSAAATHRRPIRPR